MPVVCSVVYCNILLLKGFLLLQLDRRGNQVAPGAPVFTSSPDSWLGRSPWQFNAATILRGSTRPLHLFASIRQWQLLPGHWCRSRVWHRSWSGVHCQRGVDRRNDGRCRIPRCIPVLADYYFLQYFRLAHATRTSFILLCIIMHQKLMEKPVYLLYSATVITTTIICLICW